VGERNGPIVAFAAGQAKKKSVHVCLKRIFSFRGQPKMEAMDLLCMRQPV